MSFFAPHQAYASRSPAERADEFRAMVKALHAAGIEVVLDVVYNHTAEGDETGPTYSYRGHRQQQLLPARRRTRATSTTPAAATRFERAQPLRAEADPRQPALLGRARCASTDSASTSRRSSPATATARSTLTTRRSSPRSAREPDFAGVRAGRRGVGPRRVPARPRRSPASTWLQWNGRFRDDVRAFVRGDAGHGRRADAAPLRQRRPVPRRALDAYRPYQSVNFVTAHDGFCLYDLVVVRPEAQRGQRPRQHRRLRRQPELELRLGGRRRRAGRGAGAAAAPGARTSSRCCCSPTARRCSAAGDEFLHTQRGNNNPYNQDNEITWLDWGLLDRKRRHLPLLAADDRVPQGAPVARRAAGSGATTCAGMASTGRRTSATRSHAGLLPARARRWATTICT